MNEEGNSLNFLRTGYYHRSNGYINIRIALGDWWASNSTSSTYGYYVHTEAVTVDPQHSYYRGAGFAVRCVVREG